MQLNYNLLKMLVSIVGWGGTHAFLSHLFFLLFTAFYIRILNSIRFFKHVYFIMIFIFLMVNLAIDFQKF